MFTSFLRIYLNAFPLCVLMVVVMLRRVCECRVIVRYLSLKSQDTVSSYLNRGQLRDAHNTFDQMPHTDIASWNAILSALRNANHPPTLFQCFSTMRRLGFTPNAFTLSLALSALFRSHFAASLLTQLHGLAIRLSLHSGVFVGSALLRSYGEAGDPKALVTVFHDIIDKDASSYNALVSGYMRTGCIGEAESVFWTMPEKNGASWLSLINGYITNRRIDKAWHIFDAIGDYDKSVASWTAMIDGYIQNRSFAKALALFASMLQSTVRPNRFTFSSALTACAGSCSLLTGRQVHSTIVKSGVFSDIVLSNSMVDMYAKCGDINAALIVSEDAPNMNVASWNSIIGACARHGMARKALDKFARMRGTGIRPDRVTFVNVLSACARSGLVEEGVRLFSSMQDEHGIKPGNEHYACLVGIYGRAGMVEVAAEMVRGMPVVPDAVVWGALLAAAELHSSVEVGNFALKGLSGVRGGHLAGNSRLSRGSQSRVAVGVLRGMMKRKQNAASWLESPQCSSYFINIR